MGLIRIGAVDGGERVARRPAKTNKSAKGGRRDKLGRPWRPRAQNLPKHHPTPESRAAVQALNAGGFTHQQIVDYLRYMLKTPVSRRGLERFYAAELALGKTHQILVAGQTMYRKAVGAPAQYDAQGNLIRAEIKPETVACIFYLKAQAGWRDHTTVSIDPDQKPIPVEIKSLTDKQLDELETRLLARVEPTRRLPAPK